MRILIAIFLPLLMPFLVSGGQFPFGFWKTAAASGVTFLVNEGFEGTGAPANWDAYPGAGSADFDYTTIVLQGAQSMMAGDGASDKSWRYGNTTPLNNAELWGRMLVQFDSSPGKTFLLLRNSSGAQIAQLYLQVGGTILVDAGGGGFPGTTDAVAINTTVYVWWHYNKGTGANATMEVWWSLTSTKPASGGTKHAIESTGTAITNAATLLSRPAGMTTIYDDFKVSASSFE